jgi:hypothetical protein
MARGERNAFQIMGTFSPWGRWLEVSAEGRRTRRIPLTEALGTDADPTSPPPGTVALARGEPPEETLRDLAGTYMLGGYGFGGCAFVIEPDGRFAWNAWGCTFHTEEYGHVKRRGGEIELVPIPQPGREVNPLVTSRYRTVPWGDRLYLSLADDGELRDFCRTALMPDRPSRKGVYGSYRRLSDGDAPPPGLPRLPAGVWVRFVADEIGDAMSGARRAFGSLVPGLLRPREAAGSPDALPALPLSDAVAAREA